MAGGLCGHALSTTQAGGDEVPRIGTIGVRAWSTHGRPSCSARFEKVTVGFFGCGVAGDDFTCVGIDLEGAAGQPYRVLAPSGGAADVEPSLESRRISSSG